MENSEIKIKEYVLASPFAGDTFIAEAFLKFKEDYNIVNAIETGTHIGSTFEWLYDNFDKVYTCELDKTFFQIACKLLFRKYDDSYQFPESIIDPPDMGEMIMKNGDSVSFINEIAPILTGESLFFLDAHWNSYCPLLDELAAIASAHIKPAVIAIHDFKTRHPEILGYDCYNGQPYDLDWITPSINLIYGNDWHYEYNTPQKTTGAMRGIVYIIKDS
ncbi:MAG: hypothetical protein JWP94_536 [Mucilaginibacter sp.]|nr:hypothetical protein [Mucilaginibacter sp.]